MSKTSRLVALAFGGIMLAGTANAVNPGPVDMPFADSFAGGTISNWNTEILSGSKNWEGKTTSTQPTTSAQDGDNGFAWYYSYMARAGEGARLYTPEINTAGATNATVEFWFFHYDMSSAIDKMALDIRLDGGEWTEIENSEILLNGGSGWTRYRVHIQPLLEGSTTFSIGFHAKSEYKYNMSIDNVSIFNALDEDLLATLAVSETAVAGNDQDVVVKVTNKGTSVVGAGNYSVALYYNEGQIATFEGTEIAPDAVAEFTYTFPFNAVHAAAEENQFKAIVTYEADEDPANNEALASINVTDSGKPAVPNLRATQGENSVTLNWDAAVESEGYVPTRIDQNFADAEFGGLTIIENEDGTTTDIRNGVAGVDWTAIDLDNAVVGTRYGYSSTIWDYFDNSTNSYAPKPQSGKLLAVVCPRDKSEANDWLVSPALNPYEGSTYDVEFSILHMDTGGVLKVNVMYSESDFTKETFDPEDFVLVQTIELQKYKTQTWNQYKATVPGTAKHIALVNSCSGEVTQTLFLDRIQVKSTMDMVLGYNVYADLEKHNEELIQGLSYEVPFVSARAAGERTFHATAVYEEGESALSEPVLISMVGIDDVMNGSYGVTIMKGGVKVMEAAEVYTLEGRRVAATSGEAFIALPSGVYIVRTASATVKVIF